MVFPLCSITAAPVAALIEPQRRIFGTVDGNAEHAESSSPRH
jgi:hypothetical protein